jgi:hypothetical protein
VVDTSGAEETDTPEHGETDAPGERDFVGAGPHDALEKLSGEEWEPPVPAVSDDRLLRTRTMGELYARQGFVERAIEIFEHLVSANPDDADLVERLGQMRAQYPAARPHAEGSPPDEVGESAPAAGGGERAPAAGLADEESPAAVDRQRSPVELGEAGVAEAGASGPRGADSVRERPISAYFEDLLAWVPGAVPIESLAPDSEKAPRDTEPPPPDAPMAQVEEDESDPDTSPRAREDGDREDEDRGDEDMDDFQSWLQSLQP